MKFRMKVTLVVISLLSVMFGIGGTALISITFQNGIEKEKNTAQKSYNMMISTISAVNSVSEWTSSQEVVDAVKDISTKQEIFDGIRISGDDEIFFEGGEGASCMEEIRQQVDSANVACKIIEGSGKHFYQQCGALEVGADTIYLEAAYDISSLYATRNEQQKTFLLIVLGLIIVSAASSYVLSFFLTRPMVRLQNVASRIGQGDYELRSRIETRDEIGNLSKEFDKMADSLVETVERQNQFVGDFTHEIKTPMTSIIGYADLIRSDAIGKEDVINAANYIFSEGKRLERLSIKMLELMVVDNDTVELSPQSPATLIWDSTEPLRQEYSQLGISLETDCEEGQCNLEPDLFVSLLVNLLENSKRAMPEGGNLRVSCRMTSDGCQLVVADTGCGIPQEALNKITDAFYRVDKARSRAMGGAGLGLALCNRIVNLHKGHMSIESRVGVGTTFTINIRGGKA